MELRRVGQSEAPDRELYIAEVADLAQWPEAFSEPGGEFVAFTAFDTANVSSDDLGGFAAKLVRQGCVYLCAWGPGCERLHDAVNLADINVNGPEGVVMTTWHEDDPLDEALYFALFTAFTETEPSAVLALTAPAWSGDVERRLRDSKALLHEVLAKEDPRDERPRFSRR